MAHPSEDAEDADASDAGDVDPAEDTQFVCSTCGGTSLPEAGDWNPPICLECDAQINFDADVEIG